MRSSFVLGLASLLGASSIFALAADPESHRPQYSLATFVVEVTPPKGHPLQAGMGVKPVTAIDDPLFVHGFVLLGLDKPIVLASVDWCGIGNDAHDLWRDRLALAAGTTRERVLVCSIHQHDAPLADLEAERLIAKLKLGRNTLDLDWHAKTVGRVAEELKQSLKNAQPITHIGTGEARVEKVASNRRVISTDGKIELWRGSAMIDPKAAEAPEGLIDPWLKTVGFWNGDKALASLTVYATHPMSHYGKGNVSADFAGLARRRRQSDDPGVVHFYANGCGGNLAPGRYNRGTPDDRITLTERLYTAWKTAWKETTKHPIGTVQFRSVSFSLDPKRTDGFARERLEAVLTDEKTRYEERVRVAYALSWLNRCDAKHQLDLPVLDFGHAVVALLPGEPFVEYQLFAQKQRPEAFVVALGYGDYGPVYIPTDKAMAEGGYEVGGWSFVTAGVEKRLKDTIRCGLVANELPKDARLQLAVGGKSQFVIVTPTKPSDEERTAAKLLADTLAKVTGATIAIHTADAVDLPKTQLRVAQSSALAPEEWAIRTAPDAIFITGGRPRGLFYGVCEFLEMHVGVYRFDPFTTLVPNKPDLSVPSINRTGKPAFAVRTMFTGFPYGHSATTGDNVRLFHVWNKNNLYGAVGEGDWERHVPEGVHTFGKLISAREFGKDHPEYFSMDADGKRMTDDKGTGVLWIQLCVTNDDVRRITLERAKKALRDDTAAAKKEGRTPTRYLVISQNDNTTDLCLCPKCKAVSEREGSQAGLLLEYVNFVARGIREEFPDVEVLTDAYNFTLQTPKSVRPERNVVVRYCDNYGFSDPTRPLTDPLNARPKAILDSWIRTSNQVAVWDYWRVFPLHAPGSFAPYVSTSAIHADLRHFRASGIQYVTVECEDFLGGGFDSHSHTLDVQSFMTLRAWVGMKLLDDPSRELNPLVETFCRGYFGPAGQPMRELHDWIAERQAKVPVRIVDVQRHIWARHLCDAEFFVTAYRHLDNAVRLAKDDPAILARIGRERIVIDSAYLWTEGTVRRSAPTAPLPAREVVLNRHRQDWQRFVAATFDADGQKKVAALIEPGLKVLGTLTVANTDWIIEAKAAKESDLALDGKLDEAVWKSAQSQRLMPRNPASPDDDRSVIRYAWTPEALHVAIEQPTDRASAILEVSLTSTSRPGIHLSLFCNQDGSVSPYIYRAAKDGSIETMKGRKSTAAMKVSKVESRTVRHVRIPWSDLDTKPSAGSEFYLNIGAYPKPDSPHATHVSSPSLIGDSPMWNSAYFGLLRLKPKE